jgi:hypothetical protein
MGIGPLWKFYGFRTAAANEVVQDWFDSCGDDLRDEIRDSLLYYENIERHLWKRPGFDELGGEGISEFQFKASGIWCRMYGDFGPKRHEYAFLFGGQKKLKNDKAGKRVAKERKKQLERNEASVHEFRWKEDAAP